MSKEAKLAYHAFNKVAYPGQPCVEFQHLSDKEQKGWDAAVHAISASKLLPFQRQMVWEAERIKRQEQMLAGSEYRLLTWDETLQETDETVCLSTLHSMRETWTSIKDMEVAGQTVEQALKDDIDANERMYRRKR